jgi:4-hydroxythreonine-4-phosphate dehydrogenase
LQYHSEREGKNMDRPIIGITMGDPAGNGAELSIQALSHIEVYQNCKPIIIGDANCMKCALELLEKQNDFHINAVKNVSDALFEFGTIDVYDMGLVDIDKRVYGKISEMCGEAAFQYVKKS